MISFVDEGTVRPITTWTMNRGAVPGRFDGGLYDADEAIVDLGRHPKKGYVNEPLPATQAAEARLPGLHLYGGMLQNGHFGHFMVESLNRLWAARSVPDARSLVFFPRTAGTGVPGFVPALFRILGVDLPLTIVERPTRFERLAVPAPAIVPETTHLAGTPEVREWVAHLRRLGGDGPRKLYVSRSRLRQHLGGFLLESHLEARFEQAGYHVLHPQEHSLEEQFAYYNSAERLVFAEGSAIHLFALVARPDQHTFMVWRRKARPAFDAQLASFGARPTVGAPALRTMWVPQVAQGAINRAQAELDFAGLHAQLAAAGFVDGPAWTDPDPARLEAELARIAGITHYRYERKAP